MMHAYRPTLRPIAIVFILGATIAQVGCQTPQPVDLTQTKLTPAQPINATQLNPLVGHKGQITIQVGNRPAQTCRYSLDKTDGNNHWRFSLEGIRDTYLQQTADGAIQITREDEHNEGVWVVYNPPIVLLPEIVAMDKPIEQRTRMTVHNLTNGSLRDQGWCTYQIELLGCRTVDTPMGRQEVYVMQTARQIELRLADVQVVSKTTYAPGLGWINEQIDRVTKPMRLFEVRQTESIRLLDRQPIDE